tara:strand:- start:1549 stop:2214 length:666 start_codon:yes stop_codon:yes gene_type:complete
MEYLSRSLLSADVSADLQSRLCASDLSWLDGRRTAGEQAALVKHNWQLDPAESLTEQITTAVSEALRSDPLVKSFCLIRKIHSLLVSRCDVGDEYGWHVDNPFTSYGRRDLSFTVFLSDESTYEGGQLEIQNSYENTEFILPAGHVFIYPSSMLHRVVKVTRGVRFACVGWIESYVRSIEDRSILFGLDAGARGLLARYGRSDELDLIFQTYTNAVRRLSV